jgi:hypothetical protein
MTSILPKLASSLGRRDEVPNQELAAAIAKSNNKLAVTELVANLDNKSSRIKSDCIKTLYEIGEIKPELLAGHINDFKKFLTHKDNRMVWGGMSALEVICAIDPAGIYKILPEIMDAADTGSVITKDNAVKILARLAGNKRYAKDAMPLLLEQIRNAPANQLPMYAEIALEATGNNTKQGFIETLTKRLPGIEKETKKARVEKVIKKLKK